MYEYVRCTWSLFCPGFLSKSADQGHTRVQLLIKLGEVIEMGHWKRVIVVKVDDLDCPV